MIGRAPLSALTIDQAVDQALERNEEYLIARSQLEVAKAEAYSRRSRDILPHVSINSGYTRNLIIPTAVFEGMRFKLGTDNQIDVGLRISQTLWHSGRVLAAINSEALQAIYGAWRSPGGAPIWPLVFDMRS